MSTLTSIDIGEVQNDKAATDAARPFRLKEGEGYLIPNDKKWKKDGDDLDTLMDNLDTTHLQLSLKRNEDEDETMSNISGSSDEEMVEALKQTKGKPHVHVKMIRY